MPGFELIGSEEKESINRLFESGSDFERGPFVKEFQSKFASMVGGEYAQAVTSCTAALKVAIEGLELPKGSEIITSAFTFVATAEAILEAKCIPVFAEIDESFNIDPDDIRRNITKKTKAIIPVHMYGAPANMAEIIKIAREFDLKIIEDTAQGLGSKYQGKWSGTIGDIGCFSFDSGKCIGTGEGGMIITHNQEYWRRAYEYYDHGHQNNPDYPRGRDTRGRYGFNFRMTELSAAIGLAQMKKLDHILSNQKSNYEKISKGIQSLHYFKRRKFVDKAEHTYEALLVTLPSKNDVDVLYNIILENNIVTKNLPDAYDWHFAGTWDHILPMIDRYSKADMKTLFPRSRDILSRTIAIMIFVNMDSEQLNKIIEVLASFAKSKE